LQVPIESSGDGDVICALPESENVHVNVKTKRGHKMGLMLISDTDDSCEVPLAS
jgi:hypothetical protein